MPFCRTWSKLWPAAGFHQAGLVFGSGVSGSPERREGYQVKNGFKFKVPYSTARDTEITEHK